MAAWLPCVRAARHAPCVVRACRCAAAHCSENHLVLSNARISVHLFVPEHVGTRVKGRTKVEYCSDCCLGQSGNMFLMGPSRRSNISWESRPQRHLRPSLRPTDRPNEPSGSTDRTDRPTARPPDHSAAPSDRPSDCQIASPTDRPSDRPSSVRPSVRPSARPTDRPSDRPAIRLTVRQTTCIEFHLGLSPRGFL